MRRRSWYIFLISFAAVASLAARQAPEFRSSTDTVRVYVTVTDRDGRLVMALAKSDFALRDDGFCRQSRSSTTRRFRSASLCCLTCPTA